MFILRFAIRAPIDGPAKIHDMYKTAVDMAAWSEDKGCAMVGVPEHHSSPDGYIPSPLILATAIAARTEQLRINIGALLLNMYDPVKLAEDMTVLDIISRGRVSYTIGLGYRPEEYAMFGVPMNQRGKFMDKKLDALMSALSGERFDYEGRQVHVTPSVFSENGISMSYGGHSRAGMQRAGKYGLGVLADRADPGLEVIYHEACRLAGQQPKNVIVPQEGEPATVYVAEDVDVAWETLGAYLLHDAHMYAQWQQANQTSMTSFAKTIDDLRQEAVSYHILSIDEAVDWVRKGKPISTQPLCGGIPPDVAWQYVNNIARVEELARA